MNLSTTLTFANRKWRFDVVDAHASLSSSVPRTTIDWMIVIVVFIFFMIITATVLLQYYWYDVAAVAAAAPSILFAR